MAIKLYESLTKNNSINFPCTATGNDSIGIEVAVQAVNLTNNPSGYERVVSISLMILDQNNNIVHKWMKDYTNSYMIAGQTYVFTSATGFKLSPGIYLSAWSAIFDGLNPNASPVIGNNQIIPVVF